MLKDACESRASFVRRVGIPPTPAKPKPSFAGGPGSSQRTLPGMTKYRHSRETMPATWNAEC